MDGKRMDALLKYVLSKLELRNFDFFLSSVFTFGINVYGVVRGISMGYGFAKFTIYNF